MWFEIGKKKIQSNKYSIKSKFFNYCIAGNTTNFKTFHTMLLSEYYGQKGTLQLGWTLSNSATQKQWKVMSTDFKANRVLCWNGSEPS